MGFFKIAIGGALGFLVSWVIMAGVMVGTFVLIWKMTGDSLAAIAVMFLLLLSGYLMAK
jgi:hypothetical protein